MSLRSRSHTTTTTTTTTPPKRGLDGVHNVVQVLDQTPTHRRLGRLRAIALWRLAVDLFAVIVALIALIALVACRYVSLRHSAV
jgi:hypothetical protein